MFDLDITEAKSLLALKAYVESACGGIYETSLAFYDYHGMENIDGNDVEMKFLNEYIELKKGDEKNNMVFNVNKVRFCRCFFYFPLYIF